MRFIKIASIKRRFFIILSKEYSSSYLGIIIIALLLDQIKAELIFLNKSQVNYIDKGI